MKSIQETMHPFFLRILPFARNFQLSPFSVMPLPDDNCVIFCVNHSNMHDFPVSAEIIKRHVYVLADDAPKKKAAGLAFEANGVIWMNRLDKESRKRAMEKMRLLLSKKKNLLIFPEGTWNLDPCVPMLPFSWGLIELAQELRCPIVPITLEYPDFENCFYSIGSPLYFDGSENKKEAIAKLRDIMATMRWIFWEGNGIVHRYAVDKSDYDIYVSERIEEYPDFDYDFEKEMIFNPGVVPYGDAFAHLHEVVPNKENAFLYSKHIQMPWK